MSLRNYKIISIIFIIVGLALVVGALFFFKTMPTSQKVVFILCVTILVGAMFYNLKVIKEKGKEIEQYEKENKEEVKQDKLK